MNKIFRIIAEFKLLYGIIPVFPITNKDIELVLKEINKLTEWSQIDEKVCLKGIPVGGEGKELWANKSEITAPLNKLKWTIEE